jgi:hypothetical protein
MGLLDGLSSRSNVDRLWLMYKYVSRRNAGCDECLIGATDTSLLDRATRSTHAGTSSQPASL